MASFNKFNQFVEDLAKGVHNFTSDATCTLTVALTNVAPVATNSVLADITEISYTNLSSRVVTMGTPGLSRTGGTLTFLANDLVLTASGSVGPFQYVVLYNDDPTSPANPLIGWYNYGAPVTLGNGDTFTIDFTGGFATLA